MIHLLYGPDTYRSRRALKKIREEFVETAGSILPAVFYFDGDEDASERIIEMTRDISLFSSRRLFVCERFFSGQKINLFSLRPFFAEWAGTKTTTFIFWDVECDTARPEFHALRSCATETQIFSPLSGKDLRKWFDGECASRNITVSEGAANSVLRCYGGDLWGISGELSKREVGGGATEDRMRLSEEKMWDFTDSLLVSKRRALASAVRLLHDGAEEIMLLGAAGKIMRNAFALGDAAERKEPFQAAAKKLAVHPFVARKLFQVAKGKPLSTFFRQYALLCEADKNIKTGQLPAPLAFLNVFVK